MPTWVPTSETLMENGSVDGSRSAIHGAAAAASNGDTSVRERERGVNPYGGATLSAAHRRTIRARRDARYEREFHTRASSQAAQKVQQFGQAPARWTSPRLQVGMGGELDAAGLSSASHSWRHSPHSPSRPGRAPRRPQDGPSSACRGTSGGSAKGLKPLRSGETGRCPCGSAPPRFPCRTVATGERHRRGAWSSARHPRCRR